MQTLQDMLTVEDFDVSDAFQHSRSTESVKSAASETYMSKINIAKRRANQQETEMFYFTVSLISCDAGHRALIARTVLHFKRSLVKSKNQFSLSLFAFCIVWDWNAFHSSMEMHGE